MTLNIVSDVLTVHKRKYSVDSAAWRNDGHQSKNFKRKTAESIQLLLKVVNVHCELQQIGLGIKNFQIWVSSVNPLGLKPDTHYKILHNFTDLETTH